MNRDVWNKCDICGRFVSMEDFDKGRAYRNMLTPDSEVSAETWETVHARCEQASE